MIIDCISDLHGFYPNLKGGDLLIIAGDLTARHSEEEYQECLKWMASQNYTKVIYIAGNHDSFCKEDHIYQDNIEYLCDCGTEFQGLKIWGSPWSLWFEGINEKCTSFTGKEWHLAKKWRLIPDGIDILITHCPPFGILDKTIDDEHSGSKTLQYYSDMKHPKYHIFGHIHESYGRTEENGIQYINASFINEFYRPVNDPIRIIHPLESS